eukprot:15183_4
MRQELGHWGRCHLCKQKRLTPGPRLRLMTSTKCCPTHSTRRMARRLRPTSTSWAAWVAETERVGWMPKTRQKVPNSLSS